MLSLIEEYRAARPPLDPSVVVDPFAHAYDWSRTFVHPDRDPSLWLALEMDHPLGLTSYLEIPTPVRIIEGSTRTAYLSYVNGLDPDFSELYVALQSTLSRCIPILERTLTSLHRSNPLPQRIRDTYRYRVWDPPDPPEDSDEESWNTHRHEFEQWSLYRPIEIPDIPDDGYRKGSLRFNHQVKLEADRQIQVIHRISYVDLVSDNYPLFSLLLNLIH